MTMKKSTGYKCQFCGQTEGHAEGCAGADVADLVMPAVDAHAELRKLAEAATPGEWIAKPHGCLIGGPIRHYVNGTAQSQIAACSVTFHDQAPDDEPERQQANADYIAAANPARIIALLDELRMARKDIGLQALVIQSKNAQITQAEEALAAALAQAAPASPASAPTPIDQQLARWAIDGAILKGRIGENSPPHAEHWLMEYWQIGRQLSKLGETSPWDNVTPVDSPASAPVDERAAFEAWVKTCQGHPFAGAYLNLMWKSWQARAALAAPVEQAGVPVAWLRFWAAQRYTGEGNIECDEGYEVCQRDDKGVDGSSAFPVFAAALSASVPDARAAAVQIDGEPDESFYRRVTYNNGWNACREAFTAPLPPVVARKVLTDDEIAQIIDAAKVMCVHPAADTTKDIARAIERHLMGGE